MTPQQFDAFKDCKNSQEIIAKGDELGLSISEEEAKHYLDTMNFAEISEDEIDVVSGGCDSALEKIRQKLNGTPCPKCGSSFTYVESVGGDIADVKCLKCKWVWGIGVR